jgi:hypothetical protein
VLSLRKSLSCSFKYAPHPALVFRRPGTGICHPHPWWHANQARCFERWSAAALVNPPHLADCADELVHSSDELPQRAVIIREASHLEFAACAEADPAHHNPHQSDEGPASLRSESANRSAWKCFFPRSKPRPCACSSSSVVCRFCGGICKCGVP